jgi:hypothetical protein
VTEDREDLVALADERLRHLTLSVPNAGRHAATLRTGPPVRNPPGDVMFLVRGVACPYPFG